MVRIVKGVVFDFNGTLFWDTPLHNKAWDLFLEKFDIKLSDNEKGEKIHGKSNKEIMPNIFSKPLTDDEIIKLGIEKELIYQELCLHSNLQLAPGAIDFLMFLKEINLPCTIATSSGIENIDFYFKHLDLGLYFNRSAVIFNDGSIKSKPHPDIFVKALERMGIKAEESLVFEDSFAGIQAAANAGVKNIVIINSNNDNYAAWNYPQIKNFMDFNTELLFN